MSDLCLGLGFGFGFGDFAEAPGEGVNVDAHLPHALGHARIDGIAAAAHHLLEAIGLDRHSVLAHGGGDGFDEFVIKGNGLVLRPFAGRGRRLLKLG